MERAWKNSKETIRTAMDYGLTIYDASYVSLGKLRGVSVYTVDQRLLNKTEDANLVNAPEGVQRDLELGFEECSLFAESDLRWEGHKLRQNELAHSERV